MTPLMERWGVHRVAFAVVVPTGAAALLAWALFGTAGVEMVAGLVIMLGAIGLPILRIARLMRAARERMRPIEPEDRERRRREREHRRRARAEAMRRYGSVARGSPRRQATPHREQR
jgi:hypothetical protein